MLIAITEIRTHYTDLCFGLASWLIAYQPSWAI